jgi:hypothetical protein
MGELFWWARTQLYVDYVFWNRKISPSPQGSYTWGDALPVINANRPPFSH